MGRKCIFITYSSIKIYIPLCKCVYMMYRLLPIALSTPGLLHYVCDSHIVLHMMKLTSCLSLKPRCSPTPTVVNVVEYFCGWCSMKWLVSHTLDIKIKSCYRPICIFTDTASDSIFLENYRMVLIIKILILKKFSIFYYFYGWRALEGWKDKRKGCYPALNTYVLGASLGDSHVQSHVTWL